MPKDRMQRFRLLCAMLPFAALAACQHIVATPPAQCSRLIPENWQAPVPPVPLPGFDNVGEVVGAFVAQTGQLDKANGRTADTIHIFTTCEQMQNEARPRRRFLGIF